MPPTQTCSTAELTAVCGYHWNKTICANLWDVTASVHNSHNPVLSRVQLHPWAASPRNLGTQCHHTLFFLMLCCCYKGCYFWAMQNLHFLFNYYFFVEGYAECQPTPMCTLHQSISSSTPRDVINHQYPTTSTFVPWLHKKLFHRPWVTLPLSARPIC